jgi:hypothetical protein
MGGGRSRKEAHMLTQVASRLRWFHRNEQGSEGLEKLLILAAISLPILGLLIWFANDIMAWVKKVWEIASGKTDG